MKKLLILLLLIAFYYQLFSQDYWEDIHSNDTSTIWSLEIANDGTIYYGSNSGLFISGDDGANWEFKPLAKYHYIYDLAFDLDSNLICATNNKIYKYIVDYESWEFMFQPEINQQFYALLVDSNYVFAGSGNAGLFRYDGYIWEEMENYVYVGIRAIKRDKEDRLIACGTGWSGDNGAIAESADDGETWTNLGLEDSYLFDVEVDNFNRIYAGSIGNAIYGIGGLYRYNREDNVWDTLRLHHRVQSILCTEEDSLYIGQYSTGGPPAGAFVSDDYGESWINISSGFLGPSIPNVEELTLGPDGHLYCILQDNNSIYKSSDPVLAHIKENLSLPKEEIIAYPNPFTSAIHIKMDDPASRNGFFSLFNLRGRQLLKERV